MVETLDDVLSGLSLEGSYSGEALTRSYIGLQRLEGLDLQTTHGLGQYRQLVGVDPETLHPQEVQGRRLQLLQKGRVGIDAYVRAHADEIIAGLGPRLQNELSWKYAPSRPSDDSEFERVRQQVYGAKQTMVHIKQDPESFLSQRLSNESNAVMRRIMVRNAEYFFEIKAAEAAGEGRRIIADYDPLKFLLSSRKHIDAQVGVQEGDLFVDNPDADFSKSLYADLLQLAVSQYRSSAA